MERLAKADYFEEALRLLAEGGAKRVTIANLCDALDVTKGSFYHHFTSGKEFMDQLLLYWEEAYSLALIAEARTIPDPVERLDSLMWMAAHFHHEAESAIRAYARSDAFAADLQHRVDEARIDIVAETLRANGLSSAAATQYARLALATLVGAQQTVHPPDTDTIW
jgi:AcrR family transcriptional regulator